MGIFKRVIQTFNKVSPTFELMEFVKDNKRFRLRLLPFTNFFSVQVRIPVKISRGATRFTLRKDDFVFFLILPPKRSIEIHRGYS